MTDPISDMIIRIKNAQTASKESVAFPYSRLKEEISNLLEKEKFIKGVSKRGKKISKSLEVGLIYNGKTPRIQGVKRISKSSRRIYKKASQIRPVRRGYGMLVLSTPKGVRSGEDAKREGAGGEALFEIW